MYYYRLISSMLKAVISTLGTGLYAVYKAESNTNDSLGTYNGTGQGGLTYTAGKSGNAFTFNGSNAYVNLPNNTFNTLTGDFSINMWVKIANTGGAQTLLSAFDNVGGQYGIFLFNSGSTYFDIYYGGSSVRLSESGVNPYNTWYMVTVVRKASTSTKIYYNGTLSASNTSTANPIYPTTTLSSIGVRKSTLYGFEYYCGNGTSIDEVNVWNKELTSTEVTELYNAGAGKFYPY